MPGVFSPDTPWSHGQHEAGWITAPGMQGLKVGQSTQDLLTPESLDELMGGPDIIPPTGGVNMSGPPNAYNESSPLPRRGTRSRDRSRRRDRVTIRAR